MTTSDDLIAVLEKEPSNFDLMSVIADLLEEENNYNLACVFRWCHQFRKYPRHVGLIETISNLKEPIDRRQGWYWYSQQLDRPDSSISFKWAGIIDEQAGGGSFRRWRRTFRQSMEMLIPFITEERKVIHHENAV